MKPGNLFFNKVPNPADYPKDEVLYRSFGAVLFLSLQKSKVFCFPEVADFMPLFWGGIIFITAKKQSFLFSGSCGFMPLFWSGIIFIAAKERDFFFPRVADFMPLFWDGIIFILIKQG